MLWTRGLLVAPPIVYDLLNAMMVRPIILMCAVRQCGRDDAGLAENPVLAETASCVPTVC